MRSHPDAAVVVPPRSTAVLSADAETNPTQRDQHLQSIAEHGRMAWQKSSQYNVRALVETFHPSARPKNPSRQAARQKTSGEIKWQTQERSSIAPSVMESSKLD
jgi:hypothetical protein